MVIPYKIQKQRPHDVGLLNPHIRARGLECQMLGERQAGFLFDVEWLVCHELIHRAALVVALLITEKNRAAMSNRAIRRRTNELASVFVDTVGWSNANKKAQPERNASRLGRWWHKEIGGLDAAMQGGNPDGIVGLAGPFGPGQAVARLPLVNG